LQPACYCKAVSFAAVRTGTPRFQLAFNFPFETEEAMQHRFKSANTPEMLSLFAIIVAMTMFGAGIFYEGTLLQEPQRTMQLAFPDMNP
jgi:hypothetical protein